MSIFNRPLPAALTILHELAADLHWSWNHAGDQLLHRINAEVWEQTQNPISVLQLTSDEQFERLAQDAEFVEELKNLVLSRRQYMTEPAWFRRHYLHQDYLRNINNPKPLRGIAYFSMEFGLCDALPLYAGGLGILAGDYLKTASDLGIPLVGIGLLYQEGYFRQSLNYEGWQQETYLFNDPSNMPMQPLRAADGSWLFIETQFLCRTVRFRVWQVQVGRIMLYLLDSNDPFNQVCDRGITSKLYGGGTELRLVQEIALGICGWRLIETLGLDIDICHLNEGHAAFATLERIRAYSEKNHVDFWHSLWATRAGNLFTTHTPVVAGFDRYPIALLKSYIGQFAQQLGISIDVFISLGRTSSDTEELFNMAYLAMNTCARSNGVSQLHGKVSQRIFQPLFPRWPEYQVPVGAVTNGVHMPSWDSSAADELWTALFGKARWRDDVSKISPELFNTLTDSALWKMVAHGRAQLVDYARQRLTHQWQRDAAHNTDFIFDNCTITTDLPLSPNILTLGFARRFAEYKRPDLLLHDKERLARLLNNTQKPVQLIVAGKAHPADDIGKHALQHWHDFIQKFNVRNHLVFIEDYNITLAQKLVQGVDVWINNPRRPWEACGTSGMKVLVNGGLNLSSLDGWWAEAYEPNVGWALGDGEEHDADYDNKDAEQLYQILENQIIPLFYQRDQEGLPREWINKIRTSMSKLTGNFSSNRMLKEYLEHYYFPAAKDFAERSHNNGKIAHELHQWHHTLQLHWHEIHIEQLQLLKSSDGILVVAVVYLGDIQPDTIDVQVIADATKSHPTTSLSLTLLHKLESAINTYKYTTKIVTSRAPSDFTARIISKNPYAHIPAENNLIYWHTNTM